MALKEIDEKRRGLLPWEYEDHKAYVLGQYGKIKATHPADARGYIEDYKKKEKLDDEAYEKQGEYLKSLFQAGATHDFQELPEKEKLEWIPEDLPTDKEIEDRNKTIEKEHKEEEQRLKEENKSPPVEVKSLTVDEFDVLKAPAQKKLLKKLGVEGDVSTQEERIALYKKFLK